MKSATKIKFTVEVTSTGYSAYNDEYGVYTTGENYEDLKKNLAEAMDTYNEAANENIEYEIQPELDLPQFFQFYKVINASAFAAIIGMQQSLLSQYINGIKRPSAKQTERIMNGVREVGKELANINFHAV